MAAHMRNGQRGLALERGPRDQTAVKPKGPSDPNLGIKRGRRCGSQRGEPNLGPPWGQIWGTNCVWNQLCIPTLVSNCSSELGDHLGLQIWDHNLMPKFDMWALRAPECLGHIGPLCPTTFFACAPTPSPTFLAHTHEPSAPCLAQNPKPGASPAATLGTPKGNLGKP